VLNLGQVILHQCFLSALHTVLAVGQYEWQEIPLTIITDHMQLRQVSWAYCVAGGNRTENDTEKYKGNWEIWQKCYL